MDTLLYLGKTALIIVLFYGVYQFALKKETFFTAKRHFLLSGIIAAIVVPLLEFTKTIYKELPASLPVFTSEELQTLQPIVPEEVSSFSWEHLFISVYFVGAAIILIRFMKQLISLFLFLNRQASIKKNGYSYIETSFATPPFSFFKYIVYNPTLHSKDELQMIVKHEEVHALQKHSIDTILANMLLIFQWFNPLAWKYKKSIEENLEFIADHVTVQQTQALKQYQLALVKASSTATITGLATNFHQSFIKKRIIMLNKSKSHRNNAWKLSIILPFLAFFLWSFNVKEVVEYTENESVSASEVPKTKTSFSPSETTEILSNPISKAINPSEELSAKNTATPLEDQVFSEAVSEEKNTATSNTQRLPQEIVFQISKNSTKETLDTLQEELKSKGFMFKYSNLSFNSAQEITAITITYEDSSGNAGTYSVQSENAIDTIIIRSEGSKLSVSSASNSVISNTSQKSLTVEDIEERREEIEERREEMHKKMEQRREELEVRREALEKRSNEQREHLLEISKERRERHQIQENQRKDSMPQRFSEEEDVRVIATKRRDSLRQVHRSFRAHEINTPKNTTQITKNTTTNELDLLEEKFKATGISFSYHGVKRNDAGEITKIKIKIDNNNGSISSSTYNKGDDPINTIVVGANATTTLLSSRER